MASGSRRKTTEEDETFLSRINTNITSSKKLFALQFVLWCRLSHTGLCADDGSPGTHTSRVTFYSAYHDLRTFRRCWLGAAGMGGDYASGNVQHVTSSSTTSTPGNWAVERRAEPQASQRTFIIFLHTRQIPLRIASAQTERRERKSFSPTTLSFNGCGAARECEGINKSFLASRLEHPRQPKDDEEEFS